VHADIALNASCKKYLTAELIEACEGLRASDWYTNCVKAAPPFHYKTMVALCERLRAVWREMDGAAPRTHAHKLATIMNKWLCLSERFGLSQTKHSLHRARPICFLDIYCWS